MLLTRAYHADRGERRTTVLTPDTAHGTNPASVTMAGYELVKVATDERGGVDVDDLRSKVTDDLACMMLTNPNTLGLFDENITEIAAIVHEAGGTLYYDGANLNAIMGHSRPGDMGFDIVHVNLHKSFSQPHGGGGPGSGPIAVSDRIEPYLPVPRVVRHDSGNGTRRPTTSTTSARSRSAGCAGSRATSACSSGHTPTSSASAVTRLAEASESAVLNANYLLARLREGRAGKYLPLARAPLHARVRAQRAPGEAGAEGDDARRRQATARLRVPPSDDLLPTARRGVDDGRADRDRDRSHLDAFADAIEEILAEAERDPELLKQRPYTTSVRRLDETAAARRPVVRQVLGP